MIKCPTCNEIPVHTTKVQDCYGKDFKVDLKPLGKGDVGIAYMINHVLSPSKQDMYPDADDRKYVLKQVQFRIGEDGTYDKDAETFLNETCIGIEMGDLGIAPRIYECWLCSDAKGNEYGYYTMDRIDKIMTNEYPGNPRKLKMGQELRAAPRGIQEKIVGLLEVMINANYVHNDNHPGNIGIMADGEPVLFDFGFAIKADHELTEFDKLQALGFALYQIIEQYDKDIAYDEDGVFYDLIYLIRQNKYNFGSHIQHLKNYKPAGMQHEFAPEPPIMPAAPIMPAPIMPAPIMPIVPEIVVPQSVSSIKRKQEDEYEYELPMQTKTPRMTLRNRTPKL